MSKAQRRITIKIDSYLTANMDIDISQVDS